jgi:hypothetical protein
VEVAVGVELDVGDTVVVGVAVSVAVGIGDCGPAGVFVGVVLGGSVAVLVGVAVRIPALAVAVAIFPGAPVSDSHAIPSWSPSSPNGSRAGPPWAMKKDCASCQFVKLAQFAEAGAVDVGVRVTVGTIDVDEAPRWTVDVAVGGGCGVLEGVAVEVREGRGVDVAVLMGLGVCVAVVAPGLGVIPVGVGVGKDGGVADGVGVAALVGDGVVVGVLVTPTASVAVLVGVTLAVGGVVLVQVGVTLDSSVGVMVRAIVGVRERVAVGDGNGEPAAAATAAPQLIRPRPKNWSVPAGPRSTAVF